MSIQPDLPPPGFDELPAEAQLDYIQGLWHRVLEHPERMPVPEWHREIVTRRLEEYRNGDAGPARTWAEVRWDLRMELDKIGS